MRTKQSKRLLALFLSLMMVLGLMPLTVFAEEDEIKKTQIAVNGDWQYFDEIGGDADEKDFSVAMRKTISDTNLKENRFQITIEVQPTYRVIPLEELKGVDIVIALDVSTSMDFMRVYQESSGKPDYDAKPENPEWVLEESRWNVMKEATTDFITKVLTDTPDSRISIVIYGGSNKTGLSTNHKVIWDWNDWKDDKDWDVNFENLIGSYDRFLYVSEGHRKDIKNRLGSDPGDSLRNYWFEDSSTNYGATNNQAGFMAAEVQFKKLIKEAEDQGDIYSNLTYLVYMSDGDANTYYGNASRYELDPNLAVPYYSSNTNRARSIEAAQKQAERLKNEVDGIRIFTIGFQTLTTAVLDYQPAVDAYFLAEDTDNLTLVYDVINRLIYLEANPWQVSDPMGDYILLDEESISLQDYVTVVDGVLTWDLMAMPQPTDKDGIYRLTYEIELDMSDPSVWKEEAVRATNGATYLSYKIIKKDGMDTEEFPAVTVEFDVPSVRAYLGSFGFDKRNQDKEALGEGYVFVLTDEETGTEVCEAVSDPDGAVLFEHVPSGRTYILKEKTLPAGEDKYILSPEVYTVEVAYGSVTITDASGEEVNWEKGFSFTNYYVPDEVTMTITKEIGTVLEDNVTFTFGLFTSEPKKGDEPYKTTKITLRSGSSAEGTFTLDSEEASFLLGLEDSKELWVAELLNDGTIADGKTATDFFTNRYAGFQDVKVGEWTYTDPVSVEIARIMPNDGEIELTFVNAYAPYIPVFVTYYMNGVPVETNYLESHPAGATIDEKALIEDPKANLGGAVDVSFVKAKIDNGADLITVSDARNAFSVIDLPESGKTDLHVYYRQNSAPGLNVLKSLGDLNYDEEVMNPNYTFTFYLYANGDRTKVAAWTEAIRYDDDASTMLYPFTFASNWQDYIGDTLYLVEVADDGWTSIATENPTPYCVIDEKGVVHLVDSGRVSVSNDYDQPGQNNVGVSFEKYFEIPDEFMADFIAGVGDDGATLDCTYEPKEGEAPGLHTHDWDCYHYTFIFDIYQKAGNGRTLMETVELTLSAAELMELVKSGASASIDVVLSARDPVMLSGEYEVEERFAHDYIGWSSATPIAFKINEFGRVTVMTDEKMVNIYNETYAPGIFLSKNLVDDESGRAVNEEETFAIIINTTEDAKDAVLIQDISAGGLIRIDLRVYLGQTETLYIWEEAGKITDGTMIYDESLYTVEIVDGAIQSILKDGDEIEGSILSFENRLNKDDGGKDRTPVVTVTKFVNTGETDRDEFSFLWEVYEDETRIYSGTKTIYMAGQTAETETLSLPGNLENFTGYILVSEVIPGDYDPERVPVSGGWSYDGTIFKLVYEDGLLLSVLLSNNGDFEELDGNINSNLIFQNHYYQENGGIVLSKVVAEYTGSDDFAAYPYSDRVTLLSSGGQALFKITLTNDSNLAVRLDDLQDYFQGVAITEFLKADGTPVTRDEILAELAAGLLGGDSYSFYYLTDPLTSRGDYTNIVSVQWTELGEHYTGYLNASARVENSSGGDDDIYPDLILTKAVNRSETANDRFSFRWQAYVEEELVASGTETIDMAGQTWKTVAESLRDENLEYFRGYILVSEVIPEGYDSSNLPTPVTGGWIYDESEYMLVYDGSNLLWTAVRNDEGEFEETENNARFTNFYHQPNAGLVLSKKVAQYVSGQSYDSYTYSDGVVFANSGRQAIFQVTLENTSDNTVRMTSLTDTYRNNAVTSFLKADGTIVTADEILAELNGVLEAGQSYTFYYISNSIGSTGTYTNTVTFGWSDMEEDYSGTITDSASVQASWNTGGGGGGGGGGGSTGGTTIPNEEVPLNPFIDGHYAYIVGYTDGYVRPGQNLSRAEAATVFFRLLTDTVRGANWTQENPYSDVALAHWFNNAVSVMSKMEILSGYPDGTFLPNSSISRAELATISAKFARMSSMATIRTVEFSDISGHWAEEDILYAAAVGYLDGYEDGTYDPDAMITRAEFMTIVNRMLGRAPETVNDLHSDMVTWPDNTTASWYYLEVQEATNSHNHQYKDTPIEDRNGFYETWTEIIANRDWTLLEHAWSEANSVGTAGAQDDATK